VDGLKALVAAEAEEVATAAQYLAELLAEGDAPDAGLLAALAELRKVNGRLGGVVRRVEGDALAPPAARAGRGARR
jgi:hypothetical protein